MKLKNLLKRKSRIGRKYNHKRGKPFVAPKRLCVEVLPPSVDLRPQFPPCYDQGSWGTCVSNAVAGVIEFLQPATTRWVPSRMFLAWNAVTIHEEDGVRDFPEVLAPIFTSAGYTAESLWPYDFDHLDKQPNAIATMDALKHKIGGYLQIPANDVQSIKAALAQGKPVMIGVQCYSGFEDAITASSGDVPTPGWIERLHGCLGGHGIVLVGYDDAKQKFIFRNSWGTRWGNNGFGTLGYDYISNSILCDDAWTIASLVEVTP